MQLKLKEEPIEWLKFTAVMGTMLGLIWSMSLWQGWHQWAWWLGWIPGLAATGLCALFPQWFRGFYRVGTTLFFHIGQVMGRILLTIFFLLILTPLGVILRWTGNDLLGMKKQPNADSYWKEPRQTGGHDKMF